MSIENYQKLLINKSRKYQIKKIRQQQNSPVALTPEEFSPLTDVEGLISEQDDPGVIQHNAQSHKLNAEYFEAKLLKESERSVDWLLEQLKPESSRKDRLILQEITGYDYELDVFAQDHTINGEFGTSNYDHQERSLKDGLARIATINRDDDYD